MDHLLGGIAALSSAALFALASILYRRLGRAVMPAVLNLAKGVIAVVLTMGVLAVTGFELVAAREALLLAISGNEIINEQILFEKNVCLGSCAYCNLVVSFHLLYN